MSAEEIFNIFENIEKGECHTDSKKVHKLQNMAYALTGNLNESGSNSENEMKLRSEILSLEHEDLVNLLVLILPAKLSQMSSQNLIEIINMFRPDNDYSLEKDKKMQVHKDLVNLLRDILPAKLSQMSSQSLIQIINVFRIDNGYSLEKDKKMPVTEQILQQAKTFPKKDVLNEEAMDTTNRGFTSYNKKEESVTNISRNHVTSQAKKTTTPQINSAPKDSLSCEKSGVVMERTFAEVVSGKAKSNPAKEEISKGVSSSEKNVSVTKKATNHEKDGRKMITKPEINSTLRNGLLSYEKEIPVMTKTSLAEAASKKAKSNLANEISEGGSSSKKNALVTKTATYYEKDGIKKTKTPRFESTVRNGASSSKKNSLVTKTATNHEKEGGEKTTTPRARRSTLGNDSLLFKKKTSIPRITNRNGIGEEMITESYKKSTLLSKGSLSCKKETPVMTRTSASVPSGKAKSNPTKEEISEDSLLFKKETSITRNTNRNGTGEKKITAPCKKSTLSKSSCEEKTNPMKTSVADVDDEGKTNPTQKEISKGSKMNRNETKKATTSHTGKEESKRQEYTSIQSKFEIDGILDYLSERQKRLFVNPNDQGLVIMPVIQQSQNSNETTPQQELPMLIRRTTPGATAAPVDGRLVFPVFPIQEGVIFDENISLLDEELVIMPLIQQNNFFAGTLSARQHRSVNPNEDGIEGNREVERERDFNTFLRQEFACNSSLDTGNYHEEGINIQQIRSNTPAATAEPDDGTVAIPVFPIQEGVVLNQAIQDILN